MKIVDLVCSLIQQETSQPEAAVFFFLITSNDWGLKDKMNSERLVSTGGFSSLTVLYSDFILRNLSSYG